MNCRITTTLAALGAAAALAGCGGSSTVSLKSFCQSSSRSQAKAGTSAFGSAGSATAKAVAAQLDAACLDTAAAHKLGPNLTKSQVTTLKADENQ